MITADVKYGMNGADRVKAAYESKISKRFCCCGHFKLEDLSGAHQWTGDNVKWYFTWSKLYAKPHAHWHAAMVNNVKQ